MSCLSNPFSSCKYTPCTIQKQQQKIQSHSHLHSSFCTCTSVEMSEQDYEKGHDALCRPTLSVIFLYASHEIMRGVCDAGQIARKDVLLDILRKNMT